jgi:DNA-binding protein HU-beta
MTKTDVIARIAKETGSTKTQAAKAVDTLLTAVTRALKKGDAVTFVGFGTFKTSQRKARTARNPQTGATLRIPRRKAVRFMAGKALKSAVN